MTTTTPQVLPGGQSSTRRSPRPPRPTNWTTRKHVFHSWSAQAQITPMTIVASEGSYVWDGVRETGISTSPLSWCSPTSATSIRKSLRPLPNRPRSCARSRRSTPTRPGPRRPADRRAHARRPDQGVLHKRRRRRGRARGPDGPAAHRPAQGALALPLYHGGTDTAINLTGDPRRYPNDYGSSGVVHFNGRSCTGRRSTPRPSSRSPSGRWTTWIG